MAIEGGLVDVVEGVVDMFVVVGGLSLIVI